MLSTVTIEDETQDIGTGLKILMMHPGASWSTHDVFEGLRFGLSYHGAATAQYKLDVRIARMSEWLMFNWEKSKLPETEKPNARDIQFKAASDIIQRAVYTEPDWIFIVSGMYVDIKIVEVLKRCGFKLAILLTESPYDDDAQVEFIEPFDAVFTNERASVERLRTRNPNTHYLAHAWHPAAHVRQHPLVLANSGIPESDVLFIGTGFEERCQLLSAIPWGQPASGNAELSLYGHWTDLDDYATLKSAIRGETIDNPVAARMYQRARVNLNLHRTSKGISSDGTAHIVHAESLNPRCYELAACGAFFLTDPRAELTDVFGPDLIPTFDSPDTLAEQLRIWRDAPAAREAVVKAAFDAVQPHNWVARAKQVLSVLTAV